MKKIYLEPDYVYHNTKKSKDEMTKRTHKKIKRQFQRVPLYAELHV